LLDQLGERREAIALEDDRGGRPIEREDRAHGGVVDRADRADARFEQLPPRRACLEGELMVLDQALAGAREHDRAVWPHAELCDRDKAGVAVRGCEQRGHGLVDRSHAASIAPLLTGADLRED
jgi:hypothetical protein